MTPIRLRKTIIKYIKIIVSSGRHRTKIRVPPHDTVQFNRKEVRVKRPDAKDYSEYYHNYVQHVPEGDILDILDKQADLLGRFFAGVNEEKSLYRYEEGKWSIREVVGHLLDVERIFSYRAFRFSRGDQTELPGFDENSYVPKGNYDQHDITELVEEFYLLRKATVSMFRGFDKKMWELSGKANGAAMSVRAVAWILAGHLIHHMKVIQSRYLSK